MENEFVLFCSVLFFESCFLVFHLIYHRAFCVLEIFPLHIHEKNNEYNGKNASLHRKPQWSSIHTSKLHKYGNTQREREAKISKTSQQTGTPFELHRFFLIFQLFWFAAIVN